MAARSNTAYQTPDMDGLTKFETIRSTQWDIAMDNMELFLDTQQLLVSDCWYAWSTTVTSPIQEVYRFYTMPRDICDVSGGGSTINASVSVRYWSISGSVDIIWDLATFDSAGMPIDTTSEVTETGTTAPTWGAFQTVAVNTNDDRTELRLRAKAGSAGTIFLGGIAVYA